MTEEYWLVSTDPFGLVRWLLADVPPPPAGRPTRRRVRLIAAAAADRYVYTLPRAGRHLFRYADQFIADETDRTPVVQIASRRRDVDLPYWAMQALGRLVGPLAEAEFYPWLAEFLHDLPADAPAQAELIRDIVGDPFRPLPAFDPSWRTAAAVGLARSAAGRRWDRLPLLADALEEAGCDEAELLDHCRSGGPHAVGCWAADRVLGKR